MTGLKWSEFKSHWTELIFENELDVMRDSPKGIEYIHDAIFSIVSRELFSGRGPTWWSPQEAGQFVFLTGQVEDDLEELETLDVLIGMRSDEEPDFRVRLFVRDDQIEIWQDVFGEWIKETRRWS